MEHTATPFEMPEHPHPAAQNDAERVIEIDGEKAIVVVKATEGHDAERIAKGIVGACNAHDDLVKALIRIERAIDMHLGRSAWTQTGYIKGVAHSEKVRNELYAAHDEVRTALSKAGA